MARTVADATHIRERQPAELPQSRGVQVTRAVLPVIRQARSGHIFNIIVTSVAFERERRLSVFRLVVPQSLAIRVISRRRPKVSI
jgi:hypothetical protein